MWRILALFDKGDAKYQEDFLILSNPFFGVLDGVSAIYDPAVGPKIYHNQYTGAQMVGRIVCSVFANAAETESLERLMYQANQNVRNFALQNALPTDDASRLPGVAFAITKISSQWIEIIQGGDCFAVWVKTSGKIGCTPNQCLLGERQGQNVFRKLMAKYQGDRTRAWQDYVPHFAARQKELANNPLVGGLALLNGQDTVFTSARRWTFHREEIRLLLLFTDGVIPFPDTENAERLGKMVINRFREGGLLGILHHARKYESNNKKDSHVDHAEASAIGIELD